MHMSFWWSNDVGDFIFKGFSIHSTYSLVATCFGVASLAFFFEWLRYLQAKQRQRELVLRARQIRMICPTDSSAMLTQASISNTRNPLNITMFDRALLFGAELSLWFILQNLGYLIMLCVMVYNGWFFISAILGGGLGYFIFGQMFMKINLQNCQIMRETFCMSSCGEHEAVASNEDGETTPALVTPSSSRDLSRSVRNDEISVSVHAECND